MAGSAPGGVFRPTPLWNRGLVIGETYASPVGHAGVPGLAYSLVGTGISSRSITDLTKYLGQAMRNFKIYKVSFRFTVCISVSPVHSLDDGACHKRSLGWRDYYSTVHRLALGQPACRFQSNASVPRLPE